MNHFSLFNLPIQYHLNTKTLKQLYIQQAQQTHPDYFTLTDQETQQNATNASAQLNIAYNTLANPTKRLEHILTLYDLLNKDNTNKKLSQQFLMKMLEINELIEELKQKPDPKTLAQTQQQINNLLNINQQQIENNMQSFDTLTNEALRKEKLSTVLQLYLEQKHLLRLCENLANFAPV